MSLPEVNEKKAAIVERMRNGDLTVSNKDVVEAFAIDPFLDPYTIPLDQLDPAHPALFANDTLWNHLKRLREEDPVHYTSESQFGPYWSITKYKDIMHVDTHHQTFSSQQKLGGISLGGIPVEEGDPYALPMFIAEDPPKHDAQRAVVSISSV